MDVYNSEEEQIKALKDWWSENGTSIIIGVVIGVGGFWGYNWWKDQTIAHEQKASESYEAAMKINASEKQQEFVAAANKIKDEFGATGYALLASLHISKQLTEAGDFAAAEKELAWAVENATGSEMLPLLKIRQARVLNAQAKFDAAKTLLLTITDKSYTASVQQVLGDTYLALGDQDAARSAYQLALESADVGMKSELEQKIDDLAVNTVPSTPEKES